MAARSKNEPLAIDFESPEWDTQGGGEDVLANIQDVLHMHVLPAAEDHLTQAVFSRRVLEQTVDSTIEAVLSTVDTLFVARENEVAVTPTSLMHSSWEPEPEPQPCRVDTWLRAAIPESPVGKETFLMSEYLRTSGSGAPPQQHSPSSTQHMHRRTSAGLTDRDHPASVLTSSCHNAAPQPPASPSHQARPGRGNRSRSGSPSAAMLSSKVLTPEQAAAEDRLREELEIRKAQQAVAAELEARDAESKARLSTLARSLKGKDYSYDHQGRIVPLSAFNADSSRQLSSGAEFRLHSPGHGQSRHSQVLLNKAAAGKKPVRAAAGAAGAGTRPSKPAERKLVNDFREAPSKSQPNPLEAMNVNSGVTLRQGTQAKSGPQRPHTMMGMTKDEFARYARERSQISSPVQQASRPTQPVHFPPITAASAPSTAHGNRATRGGPPSRSQGLGDTGAHKPQSASAAHPTDARPTSRDQSTHQPLHLPRLSTKGGASGTAAAAAPTAGAAAAAAGAGAETGAATGAGMMGGHGHAPSPPSRGPPSREGGPLPGGPSPRESSTARFDSTRTRAVESCRTGLTSPVSSMGDMGTSGDMAATPLAAFPDSPPRTRIAKPKPPSQDPPPKPPTPDPNAWLVTSPDWGTSSGAGRANTGAALEASKPDGKAWEAEVGRAVRLPRDRTSQATIASPVSPVKMATLQQQRPRSMTFAA